MLPIQICLLDWFLADCRGLTDLIWSLQLTQNWWCQIWDTAGQERFRTITTSYFRGAQGILLCYSTTSPSSLESIATWITQIKEHCDASVKLCLVGLRNCDDEDHEVGPSLPHLLVRARQLSDDHGMEHFHVNLITALPNSEEVSAPFEALAHQVLFGGRPKVAWTRSRHARFSPLFKNFVIALLVNLTKRGKATDFPVGALSVEIWLETFSFLDSSQWSDWEQQQQQTQKQVVDTLPRKSQQRMCVISWWH